MPMDMRPTANEDYSMMILGYHQGRLVTYLQNSNFSFLVMAWPAKPRTGMSIFTETAGFFNFQTWNIWLPFDFTLDVCGFHNLSIWERCGFVEREGSASRLHSNLHWLWRWQLSLFFRSFHWPTPVRCSWIVFARKMHSTTKFAMTVLSKCVTHAGFVKVAWTLRGIPF